MAGGRVAPLWDFSPTFPEQPQRTVYENARTRRRQPPPLGGTPGGAGEKRRRLYAQDHGGKEELPYRLSDRLDDPQSDAQAGPERRAQGHLGRTEWRKIRHQRGG